MSKLTYDSVLVLLIGTNGTGKSTKQREVLEAAAKARKKKILVLPSNPAEPTFLDVPEISLADVEKFKSPGITSGAVRVNVFNIEEYVQATEGLKNTIIISDDFKAYFNKNIMHASVRRQLITRRHDNNDFYFAAHAFAQVPGDMYNFCSHIMLFKCYDNPKRHATKLINPNAVLEAVERVNREAAKNPYYFELIKNE